MPVKAKPSRITDRAWNHHRSYPLSSRIVSFRHFGPTTQITRHLFYYQRSLFYEHYLLMETMVLSTPPVNKEVGRFKASRGSQSLNLLVNDHKQSCPAEWFSDHRRRYFTMPSKSYSLGSEIDLSDTWCNFRGAEKKIFWPLLHKVRFFCVFLPDSEWGLKMRNVHPWFSSVEYTFTCKVNLQMFQWLPRLPRNRKQTDSNLPETRKNWGSNERVRSFTRVHPFDFGACNVHPIRWWHNQLQTLSLAGPK